MSEYRTKIYRKGIGSKGIITINEKKIDIQSNIVKELLYFEDIQSFRINSYGDYLIIYLRDNRTRISIELNKHTKGLETFFIDNFKNKDAQEYLEEKERLLNDNNFGLDRETREKNYVKAQNLAFSLSLFAVLIGLWGLFYPYPYFIVIPLNISFPLITILIIFIQKGRIRIGAIEDRTRAYPSAYLALFTPSLATASMSINQYGYFRQYSNNANLWITSTVITLGLLLLIILGVKKIKLKKVADYILLILLIFTLLMYVLTSIIFIQKTGLINGFDNI